MSEFTQEVAVSEPKVPNTISDAQMRDLQRRQQKHGEHMFSRKTVRQRKASEQQRGKAGQN